MNHEAQLLEARQTGFDDGLYDGIDTSANLPCRCADCRRAYYEGFGAGLRRLEALLEEAARRDEAKKRKRPGENRKPEEDEQGRGGEIGGPSIEEAEAAFSEYEEMQAFADECEHRHYSYSGPEC